MKDLAVAVGEREKKGRRKWKELSMEEAVEVVAGRVRWIGQDLPWEMKEEQAKGATRTEHLSKDLSFGGGRT